jgi:hypothetical protein
MFKKLVQLFAQHLRSELVQWLEVELVKFEAETPAPPAPAVEAPVAGEGQ